MVFQKAVVESIRQDIIWATTRSYGIGNRLKQILQDIGYYRGKIKGSDKTWNRHRRIVCNQSRNETRGSTVTKHIYHISRKGRGYDPGQWDGSIG